MRRSRTGCIVMVLMMIVSTAPVWPQNPSDPDPRSLLQRAETSLHEGRFEEALQILDNMEQRALPIDLQAGLYLLRARAYLGLDDSDRAEEAVREIFKRGIQGHLDAGSLPPQLKEIWEMVKAEFWFSIRRPEADEEIVDQRVILQRRQREKKKSPLPKIILGTVLVGAVTAAVLLLTKGSNEDVVDETLGKLKFENGTSYNVTLQIAGIEKSVTPYRYWAGVGSNIIYVDLPPGTHPMTVAAQILHPQPPTIKTYTFTVEILKGEQTYFLFKGDYANRR